MTMVSITITINGEIFTASVKPNTILIDLLRDKLGLTGTKKGCGTGECGACTVILDGKAVNSCLVLAAEANGKEVLTIEGLATSGKADRLQQAFVDHGAIQCGFCTTGMLMSSKALLDTNPAPNESEIKSALSGNLCRCGGYLRIIEAIKSQKYS